MDKKPAPGKRRADRPLPLGVPEPANRDDFEPDETQDVDVPWPEETENPGPPGNLEPPD